MRTYIVPYMHIDGVPTFRDSSIMEMFDKMERDGTVDSVFFDGSVRTREEFLRRMRQPGIQLYGVFVKDSDVPVGFIWMEMFGKRTARGHFCAFSEYWGDAYKIGHEILVILLSMRDSDGNYVLDAIYGFTPKDNTLALGALEAAGFKVAGTLPNAFYYESLDRACDGVMMYFTREEIPEEELYESLH